jgi:hypothetical protein
MNSTSAGEKPVKTSAADSPPIRGKRETVLTVSMETTPDVVEVNGVRFTPHKDGTGYVRK